MQALLTNRLQVYNNLLLAFRTDVLTKEEALEMLKKCAEGKAERGMIFCEIVSSLGIPLFA